MSHGKQNHKLQREKDEQPRIVFNGKTTPRNCKGEQYQKLATENEFWDLQQKQTQNFVTEKTIQQSAMEKTVLTI
jgi:hypothetical protein